MKKFTYMALGLLGIMGMLSVGVVNAECNEGEEYVESESRCYPSRAIIRDPITNDIIQLNDQEWNDLEVYLLTNTGAVLHYTIMDRNMGASDVYNQDWDHSNPESYGYVYQRGNNYGFTSTSSISLQELSGMQQVPESVRSGFSPSLYSSNIRYGGADSWMGSGGLYDNIWGGRGDNANANGNGTTGDRKGPCPDGYYIPSVHDWNVIKNKWSAYSNRSDCRTGFAYDLLLPPAGVRKNESGVARVYGTGQIGDYRTSSPRTDLVTGAYVLYFGTGVDGANVPITGALRSRSMGASLRCFKDNFQSDGNLNFHLNGGGKGMVAVNGGKFTSMSSPSRDNSIFEGWYTTLDFQTGTKIGVGSGTDGVDNLYAKWGCNEGERYGYVLSGNACERGTRVIFNTNGGVSQSWSITVPYGTVLDFSGGVVNFPNGMTVDMTGEVIAYSGQTFVGWTTGNNNRAIKTLVIDDNTDNIILHAIFRNDFKIKFNATENGGDTDSSIFVPYGTLVDLSVYTATKGSGGVRTFLGRNTDPDATEVLSEYEAEDEDSDSVTLYAIFRKDKFYIDFDTNGHGVTPSTQIVNRGEKINDPGNLTASGYKFEGWSDNEYLTTNFNFGIYPTDDLTLYAKWRVPGDKCYEGFEYDNNLGMCVKENEWVIRVGMNGTVLLSSKYSDVVDWYISMEYSGLDLSKVQGIDIAKSYLGVILSQKINQNYLDIDSGEGSNSNGQILEISAGSGEDKKLLFTMITNWRCRGEEPDLSCNFNSLDTIKADNISSWDNVSIPIPDITKQNTPPEFLERFEWADNIRIIFDPRVAVTFDSNGHGVSPERQFLNKGSRVRNPGSLSAVGYKFLGWSDDEYLTSIFDFKTAVNRDIKLYAKWQSIGGYSCSEGQEYDNSVGVCKKPKDWVIRIGYNGDVEFSSGYSLFLDETLLKEIDSSGMDETEVEVFKKAFGILMAVLETFDGTDEIMIDEDIGIVMDGDLWLLDYYNKDGKLLFTVVVDMAGTDLSQWSIHTRSMYVNVANNISSSDNLKLVPSSTGINEYVEAYPQIAQLENLRIVFSDRMEPNIDNGGKHYSGGGGHKDDKVDEHYSAESENDIQDNSDEFQDAYKFAYENEITTMDTIDKADMEGPLTRIAMAKMLSNYAINVLGKKPANIVVPNFPDITTELDEEYNYGVTLAYQLGIMGINIDKFRPDDLVTRAEFATALSRMLFSTPDGDPYYLTHIEKLKEEGIITNDDPDMQELRGYVMIMLMRSAM